MLCRSLYLDLLAPISTVKTRHRPCRRSAPIRPPAPFEYEKIRKNYRTGPGKALDGEPQFDLGQWNPVYFQPLHRFLTRASELEIFVELTLFSIRYSDRIWDLNPLSSDNNVNHLPLPAFEQDLVIRIQKEIGAQPKD